MIVRCEALAQGGLVLERTRIGRVCGGPSIAALHRLVSVVCLSEARVSLALDLREEVWSVSLEKGVSKLDLSYAAAALVEVVHVQLPDERVQIVVLEVLRQGLVCEPIPVHHFKGEAIWCPLDYACQVLLVDDIKQLAKEDGHLGLGAIILFSGRIKILHFIILL